MKSTLLVVLITLSTLECFAQSGDSSNPGQNYMDQLFQRYILNELDAMQEEEYNKLNRLDLYKIYERNEEDWTATIAAVLNFSNTIDIAIWDLWITKSEQAAKENQRYSKEQFAVDFIEHYYAPDSQVDVWRGAALKEAKQRIKIYRGKQ